MHVRFAFKGFLYFELLSSTCVWSKTVLPRTKIIKHGALYDFIQKKVIQFLTKSIQQNNDKTYIRRCKFRNISKIRVTFATLGPRLFSARVSPYSRSMKSVDCRGRTIRGKRGWYASRERLAVLQKIASRRRRSQQFSPGFVPRFADCRRATRASPVGGLLSVYYVVSVRDALNITRVARPAGTRGANSAARNDIVTFARKRPHDELMTPRDGDFVATRRHCFLRIGIHLVTGRVLSRRRMDVAEVIIGRTGFEDTHRE